MLNNYRITITYFEITKIQHQQHIMLPWKHNCSNNNNLSKHSGMYSVKWTAKNISKTSLTKSDINGIGVNLSSVALSQEQSPSERRQPSPLPDFSCNSRWQIHPGLHVRCCIWLHISPHRLPVVMATETGSTHQCVH